MCVAIPKKLGKRTLFLPNGRAADCWRSALAIGSKAKEVSVWKWVCTNFVFSTSPRKVLHKYKCIEARTHMWPSAAFPTFVISVFFCMMGMMFVCMHTRVLFDIV